MKKITHLFLIQLFSTTLFAQTVSLIKDINTTTHSFANSFVLFDSLVYFAADDGIHGNEIWRSNVKENGTAMAFDLNAGATGSNPTSLYVYNNSLFFFASNGSGKQLWKTNGKLSSTVQLTTGTHSVFSTPIIGLNGTVYFNFDDAAHGEELWSTDGTAAGTHLVKDINAGTLGSFITDFTIFNNKLYFVANAPIDTRALYVTDGTQQGTKMIFNCNEEGCRSPIVFNNKLFFISDDSIFSHPNTELYVSDGTKKGSHLFIEINNNSGGVNGELAVAGGKLFFAGDDGIHGTELWATDGTVGGTKMIKDIYEGAKGSAVYTIKTYLDKVVFTAYYGKNLGGFWISDGTKQGTIMLDTIIADMDAPPVKYAIFDNKLYFNGYRKNVGYELCATDGTPVGTGVVADIFAGIGTSSPENFVVYKNNLVFSANDNTHGYEIFKLINDLIAKNKNANEGLLKLGKEDAAK